MTERTLEKIEAHIKARGSSSIGYDLLAIAQRQREELEGLRNTVRFLAKQESRTYEIRSKAMVHFDKKEWEEVKELVVMHWPIVQGTQNQFDLKAIGNQPCDHKRVRPAIDKMLGKQA